MEGKNWGKFWKYKYKLENRCNELFTRWRETFGEVKSKERTEKFKDIDNKFHEIKECIEKMKKPKKFKNEKPIFKGVVNFRVRKPS